LSTDSKKFEEWSITKNSTKHYGVTAIEKGFITTDQFVDAMAMQIEMNMSGNDTKRRTGEILKDIGYVAEKQINEILEGKDVSQELRGPLEVV